MTASRNGAGDSPAPKLDQLADQIQTWVARIDQLPDPHARELLQECLHDVLALYGRGLERILQLIQEPGTGGVQPMDRLLEDGLVRGLLLIHGLHPEDLPRRVEGALAKVRPYLQSHGGNVELVSLEGDVARLRLLGTCQGCPSSLLTMQVAIRRALEEACPDLAGLELDDEPKPKTQCA